MKIENLQKAVCLSLELSDIRRWINKAKDHAVSLGPEPIDKYIDLHDKIAELTISVLMQREKDILKEIEEL